jgi:hypothetical protein
MLFEKKLRVLRSAAEILVDNGNEELSAELIVKMMKQCASEAIEECAELVDPKLQ